MQFWFVIANILLYLCRYCTYKFIAAIFFLKKLANWISRRCAFRNVICIQFHIIMCQISVNSTRMKLTCSSASVRLSLKLTDPMLQIMMFMCVKAGYCCFYLSIAVCAIMKFWLFCKKVVALVITNKGCPSTYEDILGYIGSGFRLTGKPKHFRGYVHVNHRKVRSSNANICVRCE